MVISSYLLVAMFDFALKNWRKIGVFGVNFRLQKSSNPYAITLSQSTGFMVGNSSTSRMELLSVSSITMRSMP